MQNKMVKVNIAPHKRKYYWYYLAAFQDTSEKSKGWAHWKMLPVPVSGTALGYIHIAAARQPLCKPDHNWQEEKHIPNSLQNCYPVVLTKIIS